MYVYIIGKTWLIQTCKYAVRFFFFFYQDGASYNLKKGLAVMKKVYLRSIINYNEVGVITC